MPRKKKELPQKKDITANVYNTDGDVVSTRMLSNDVFDIPMQEGLIHLAVVSQGARNRKGTASTKTKGEVRGGGRKPWKQKGTGRARHGSIRSPLWRGGGITFGPRPDRNYDLKMNKKAKRKALCMIFSQRAHDENIILLDTISFEQPKTKQAVGVLKKLPLGIDLKKKRKVGFIATKDDKNIRKSLRNIPCVNLLSLESLNIIDVMKCSKLIVSLSSLEKIEQTFKQ